MTDNLRLESLRHRLIVSVQADAGDPLDYPHILAAMARDGAASTNPRCPCLAFFTLAGT